MMFPHGEQSFPSFYLYIECQRSLVIALLGFGKPCLAFTLRIIPYSPVVCKGGFQTFFCLVTVASAALACPCLKGKCLTARPHRVEIVNKSASSRPRVNDFFPGRLAMLYAQSLLLYPRLVVSRGKRQSALNSIVKDRCPCPWTWGLNLIWLALLHSRALPSLVSTLHIISYSFPACKGGFLKNFWDDLFLFRSSHLPCFP